MFARYDRKFLSILMIVIVLAAVLVVPAMAMGLRQTEPPAGPVTVPMELQALIAAGIGFLITQGLKSLSNLLKKDLSGWGAAITAAFVTGIVLFLNALLTAIPEVAVEPVKILLMLIVAVLGSFGVHKTVKGFQAK